MSTSWRLPGVWSAVSIVLNGWTRVGDDLGPTVVAEIRDPTPVGALADEWDEVPEKYGFVPVEEAEPYELPFLYLPPPKADVEAAAVATPLLAKFDTLRDYLGPEGK